MAARVALTLLALLGVAVLVPPAGEAAYPGGNGKLVFFQEGIGGVEPVGLAVSDADGSNQTGDAFGPRCGGEGANRTPLPCPVDPQWSPDGELIAFGLDNALVTMRPDGSGLARLTFPNLYAITSPTWSPDGTRLAFSARHSLSRGFQTIYHARVDGSGLRQVVSRGQADQPAWSSRNEIAFRRAGNLEVINPDRHFAGARKVTSRGGARPTWSPSGLTLAFVRNVRRRSSSRRAPVLFRVTGRGRKLKRLTIARAEDPAWTPDGSGVLFVRYAENNYFIHFVDAAGRRSRVVTGGFQGRRSAVTQPDQQPLPR